MTEQVQEGNTPKKKSIKEQARKKDQFGKPMRRVKFLNNEDGNVDIAFSYQPKGGEAEGYHLLHGVEYQLPDYIIAYINELAYPMYEIETGLQHRPDAACSGRIF